MENLKNYLDDNLRKAQEYYDEQLVIFKNQIDKELNETLYQHIKHAEEEMEKAKKHYFTEYKKSMEKIAERKKTANPDSFLLSREEKMIKMIFESGIQTSISLWSKFIEDCKKDLR